MIEINPARGLFTGNRGILHNNQQQLVNPLWGHKAWIVCQLEFKNLRRPLMEPNRWTQLFFLDEATAFAAGHRPCGDCRREAYKLFLSLSGQPNAKALDAVLHEQRTRPQPQAPLHTLPDYSMFHIEQNPYLKLGPLSYPWTHSGYGPPELFQPELLVTPLTAPLFRQILASGYRPVAKPH